ncbi:MAG TPA: squalene synthase HpnC, partial [Mariprofundaceae bacterium]|nr:squalene synthase HpnC [Mariprofundaceae bacterium]
MPHASPEISQAYQHCLGLARSHYENFPTASRLLPPDLRPAVAAIYAFARHADDIADEGDASPEVRLKRLDAWESLLDRCVSEPLDHPVFLALGDAIRRFKLPLEPLHDLLVAFRMDVSIHAYASPDELLFYCRHSANPVGRLLLALHGIRDPAAIAASDQLCTALQLANFWQDLSIDLARGRCYLCEQWLKHAGLDSEQLLEGGADERTLRPALDAAIAFTDEMFRQARALPIHLPLRLRLQSIATLCGGRAILHRLRHGSPLKRRPTLSRRSWLALVPRIGWMLGQ